MIVLVLYFCDCCVQINIVVKPRKKVRLKLEKTLRYLNYLKTRAPNLDLNVNYEVFEIANSWNKQKKPSCVPKLLKFVPGQSTACFMMTGAQTRINV